MLNANITLMRQKERGGGDEPCQCKLEKDAESNIFRFKLRLLVVVLKSYMFASLILDTFFCDKF